MLTLEQLKSLPTPQRIGKRIVQIRTAREITQKELADMCGISIPLLTRLRTEILIVALVSSTGLKRCWNVLLS